MLKEIETHHSESMGKKGFHLEKSERAPWRRWHWQWISECYVFKKIGSSWKDTGQDLFFFYKIFFLFFKCGLFLKPLLNLLQHCFCFMFLEGFSPEACGILALWPGIKPSFPALKGEVLTTGPSGIFLGQTLEPVTWGHSQVCAGVTASSPP